MEDDLKFVWETYEQCKLTYLRGCPFTRLRVDSLYYFKLKVFRDSPSRMESMVHLYRADLEHMSRDIKTKSCSAVGRNQATNSVSGWTSFITSKIGSPGLHKRTERIKGTLIIRIDGKCEVS